MNQAEHLADNPYATFGMIAAEAPADARLGFIRKTYTHLAAAIYAFVALEYLIFQLLPVEDLVARLFAGGRWNILIFFACFLGVSWMADKWARTHASVGMQYAGLFLYVIAQAVFFVPLVWVGSQYSMEVSQIGQVSAISVAGITTLLIFAALTAAVFLTRKDFSFLAPVLSISSMVALVLIVCGCFGILSLGMAFSVFMVALASGYILYDTSNVLHHYRTEQHVAASLALFASVALLFWYVLQIVISLSGRD